MCVSLGVDGKKEDGPQFWCGSGLRSGSRNFNFRELLGVGRGVRASRLVSACNPLIPPKNREGKYRICSFKSLMLKTTKGKSSALLLPNASSPQDFSPSVTTWTFLPFRDSWKSADVPAVPGERPPTAPLRVPVPGPVSHGRTAININDAAPPLM